jgi:hypothetical protein
MSQIWKKIPDGELVALEWEMDEVNYTLTKSASNNLELA